jgi:NADH-quinone oxidoreductase subunit D
MSEEPDGLRELTVATSDLAGSDLVLDLGAHHPASHGVLRLALTIESDRIVRAEPLIGYLHRGAEKLFEVRDYRQIMVLANRHDWLSAFASELGVALAVERMLGLEVPIRAVWSRTLLAELNRVLSHLVFLGSFPVGGGGARSPAVEAAQVREAVQELMEEVSGGRIHFMFNRIGGLKEDLPAGWTGRARRTVDQARRRLPSLRDSILGDDVVRATTRGVGIVSEEQVLQYGVSGPIARASGFPADLRLDDPYLGYAELAESGVLRRVVRSDGDCLARLEVLAEQIDVSLDVADACLDRLAELSPGPVNVRLPKVLRAPEGAIYAWTENPLGINGYYLVSRAAKTPWRLKLRTASFNNVQVLSETLRGASLADLVPILGSMFFVVGDIDK